MASKQHLRQWIGTLATSARVQQGAGRRPGSLEHATRSDFALPPSASVLLVTFAGRVVRVETSLIVDAVYQVAFFERGEVSRFRISRVDALAPLFHRMVAKQLVRGRARATSADGMAEAVTGRNQLRRSFIVHVGREDLALGRRATDDAIAIDVNDQTAGTRTYCQ